MIPTLRYRGYRGKCVERAGHFQIRLLGVPELVTTETRHWEQVQVVFRSLVRTYEDTRDTALGLGTGGAVGVGEVSSGFNRAVGGGARGIVVNPPTPIDRK